MNIADITKHQRAMIEFMKKHGLDEDDAKELLRDIGLLDKTKKK